MTCPESWLRSLFGTVKHFAVAMLEDWSQLNSRIQRCFIGIKWCTVLYTWTAVLNKHCLSIYILSPTIYVNALIRQNIHLVPTRHCVVSLAFAWVHCEAEIFEDFLQIFIRFFQRISPNLAPSILPSTRSPVPQWLKMRSIRRLLFFQHHAPQLGWCWFGVGLCWHSFRKALLWFHLIQARCV